MNTDQQLFEAKQQLHQVQGVQQARIDAERAEQREIEQAAAEVEKLAKKARRERFNEAAAQLTANRDAIHASYRELITALSQGEIRKALDMIPRLHSAVEAYGQQFGAALDIVAPDIDAATAQLVERSPVRTSVSDRQWWQQAKWEFEKSLPLVDPVNKSIADWVAQATAPLERQIRVGLAYAVTGQWY